MVGHGVYPACLCFGEKGEGLCQSEVLHGMIYIMWSVKVMFPTLLTLGQCRIQPLCALLTL